MPEFSTERKRDDEPTSVTVNERMPLRGDAVTTGFVLSGFVSGNDYDNRAPNWLPDKIYSDVDAATVAAEDWLGTNPRGFVEVIEFRGGDGAVVRLVSSSVVEEIDAHVPGPKQQTGIARLIATSFGQTVVGLGFVALGVVFILYPDEIATRQRSPGLVRIVGLVSVVFVGGILVLRLIAAIRGSERTLGAEAEE